MMQALSYPPRGGAATRTVSLATRSLRPSVAGLTPLAKEVLAYLRKAGHVTTATAMLDLGISGGSLTRRIVDLQTAGFKISKVRARNPKSDRLYTIYYLG